MSKPDTYTRWAVIASGEGGGRIASQFFARSDNPGIEDRILILNTNRADIRNTLERIQGQVDDEGGSIMEKYAVEFGSRQGAGNFFIAGRECAQEDLPRIVRRVQQRFGGTDAFLHVATLGGGTGNGSIPYLISQFNWGFPAFSANDAQLHEPWMDGVNHAVFAVWPFYYEAPQRHFNAVCGLSRLLRTDTGEQNADMVILAANSHMSDDESQEYEEVNDWIIRAIDFMIGAGRRTRGVIDVEDYARIPSQIGAYHFTPGLVENVDGDVFELEYLFDQAAENAYVPLELSTVKVAFAVIRAPERMIERGVVTEPTVKRAFQKWKRENGLGGAAGMTTLTPKDDHTSEMDVFLMLGGFDLDPLLNHYRDSFELFKQNLQRRNGEDSQLPLSEVQRIEENLDEYQNRLK